MRSEKTNVKGFYDSFGWRRGADGRFQDTQTYVDARPALESYSQRTRRRVRKFVKPQGEYFLDAGSGAIPHVEYLEYSDGYRWRVCADFSFVALTEARAKLGSRGLYVQADLTQLPFRAGVFDAVVAAHVLYHLPADEQAVAVHEFYRALAPDGDCVIVYSRASSGLTALARQVPRVRRFGNRLRRVVQKPPDQPTNDSPESDAIAPPPKLYFHAHEPEWFLSNFPSDWHIDVRSAKSVDRTFTNNVVPDNAFGRELLAMLFWLEETFPHFMARVGTYPLVVIKKPGGVVAPELTA